jgi:hypothetical protein
MIKANPCDLGKRFPVDPRDFVNPGSDASTCDADRLVATDPPNNTGRLFTWSLGDPFFKVRCLGP